MARELGPQGSFFDKIEVLKPRDECVIELLERCKVAKIDVEVDKLELGENDKEQEFHVVKMPCGREIRPRFLIRNEDYNNFLAIEFERYTYVENYDAIANYSKGLIEAGVRPIDTTRATALKKILFLGEQNEEELSLDIQRKASDGNEVINIGTSSQDFNVMVKLLSSNRMTLKISNLNISHHDHVLDILEKISNALFFQIDMTKGIALNLIRRRKHPGRYFTEKDGLKDDEIMFPKYEYDSSPMSLYWYGRGATGMPLLQYLAYYQTLEYYFPIYSRSEAQRRARAIIKDPSFRPDRDSDIGNLLTSLLRVGGGFGDERSQLKATINECVDDKSLREFIEGNEKRKEHLSAKSKLSDKKINLANPNLDIRNDVAERIYDIRCKIVHAKIGTQDKDFELLLPFSIEAESLYHDIDIVRYIAQKTIISASSPIRI